MITGEVVLMFALKQAKEKNVDVLICGSDTAGRLQIVNCEGIRKRMNHHH